jgi:hypothetical protein
LEDSQTAAMTAYLSNGGALEHAQSMAAHDRTKEQHTQDEIERIVM